MEHEWQLLRSKKAHKPKEGHGSVTQCGGGGEDGGGEESRKGGGKKVEEEEEGEKEGKFEIMKF